MDIQYLLFLQNNVRSDSLTPIMSFLSDFSISFYILAAMFVVYWCVDKKSGFALMFSTALGMILNAIFKLSFCIYRPWVRNSAVMPPQEAFVTATGYSFPSGHAQNAVSLFGIGAYLFWNKKRWPAVLLIVYILIVGFSRNYLGVHTPQDVIVGFLLGGYSIVKTIEMLKYYDQKDKKTELLMLGKGLLIAAIAILYFTYKNYPISYDEAGNLLVDPDKMMKDGFAAVGMWMGFIIGMFLERHYIDFNTDASVKMLILRGIIGVISLYFLAHYAKIYLNLYLAPCWAAFMLWFIELFYVSAIYPAIFKKARF